MIRFEHVSQNYPAGGFELTNINFEIERGEFVFLIGSSGAGKTTILKMLLREVTPKEGNVYFNNEIISAPGFRKVEKLRQNIGTIFQDFKIVPDRNALENLLISLDILKTKNAKEVAMKSLKEVGLEKKAFFFPIQLSAGELQRLAIARAVTGGRQVIIADEPTGNLDPITAWEIIRLFNKIHKKDTTIIFATHNSEIVNTLKKRVIIMKKGRVSRDIALGEYSLEQ